ncbi:MAG: glycosyltransferase [Blastocatellales bacterium]
MRVVMFYHSLLSDWNHGNAHFLRGVVSDLLDRWHEVKVYEPHDAWSLKNLIAERGEDPIREFSEAYPALKSIRYQLDQLDLDEALDGADLALVHEWNDHELVRRVGEHRARAGNYRLLFHDTHHRSITDANGMAGYDLSNYDGVLAFGRVIRDLYLSRGWAERAWAWHEAADIRMFYPRTMCVDEESGGVQQGGNRAEESSGENSPHRPNTLATEYPTPPALSWEHAGSVRSQGWHAGSVRSQGWHAGSVRSQGDLVWIGNWGDDERAEELREFLIEPARQLNLKTCVYGVRYPDLAREMLAGAGIEYGGWLPNYRAPGVFANYKFTVHVPRRPYAASLPGIPTIRVFEALACGIPLVSAPWDDTENLFTPGEDYLIARNGGEMKRHLEALIADVDLRNALSEHGLRTILSRHTCTHRVNELLKICAELQVNSLESMPAVGRRYKVAAG